MITKPLLEKQLALKKAIGILDSNESQQKRTCKPKWILHFTEHSSK